MLRYKRIFPLDMYTCLYKGLILRIAVVGGQQLPIFIGKENVLYIWVGLLGLLDQFD